MKTFYKITFMCIEFLCCVWQGVCLSVSGHVHMDMPRRAQGVNDWPFRKIAPLLEPQPHHKATPSTKNFSFITGVNGGCEIAEHLWNRASVIKNNRRGYKTTTHLCFDIKTPYANVFTRGIVIPPLTFIYCRSVAPCFVIRVPSGPDTLSSLNTASHSQSHDANFSWLFLGNLLTGYSMC